MDAISTIENSNVLIDFSSSRLTIQDDDVDLLNITENVNANGIEQLSREEQESVKKFNDFRAGQEYVSIYPDFYFFNKVIPCCSIWVCIKDCSHKI